MTKVEIIRARACHVRTIVRRMRQIDRDGVAALSDLSPGAALCGTLRKSSVAWTAVVDGRPEVMFGVTDINVLAGLGAPWLVATTDVSRRHRLRFLRGSVGLRDQLLSRYACLKGYVHVENHASIKWLQWLGVAAFERDTVNGCEILLFELTSGNEVSGLHSSPSFLCSSQETSHGASAP